MLRIMLIKHIILCLHGVHIDKANDDRLRQKTSIAYGLLTL